MQKRVRNILLAAMMVLAWSLGETSVIINSAPGLFHYHILQIDGVVHRNGEALTLYYSRILAPYAIWALAKYGGVSMHMAIIIFMAVMLFVLNAFWALVGVRYCRSWIASIILVLFTSWALTTIIRVDIWQTTPWDWVILVFTSMFAYLAFTGAPIGSFAALFVPFLLTRESALYIPIFLAASAVTLVGKHLVVDWKRLSIAILMFVGGTMVIEVLRTGHLTNPILHMAGSQWNMVQHSIRYMFDDAWIGRIYIAIGLILIGYGMRSVYSLVPNAAASAITIGFIVISIFRFAEIADYRVWFDVLPFAFMILAVWARELITRRLSSPLLAVNGKKVRKTSIGLQ